MKRFLIVCLCISLFLSFVVPVNAYYTNMNASVVIGQPDFVNNTANQGGTAGANTLSGPWRIYTDGRRLFVSEYVNNRVLVWNNIPTRNNQPADVVIGQPDFSTTSAGTTAAKFRGPAAVYIDPSSGKLFIVDGDNARVLIYNQVPTTNGASADLVLGQTTFNTNSQNATTFGLWFPLGVTTYQGKLIVSDAGNDRVTIWNSIPTTNGAAIDTVIGQTSIGSVSFRGGTCTSVSSTTMNIPDGVQIDNSGRLYVSDRSNNRVLIYNSIPVTTGAPADLVMGQTSLTACTTSPVSINSMNGPAQIALLNNRLFVADLNNNRILVFNSLPYSNSPSADLVIGQPSFSESSANAGSSTNTSGVSAPYGLAIDPGGKFIAVGDFNNNRVMIFNNILSTPAMNINSPISQPEGKIRIQGNISLGERPNYKMQKVTAVINGDGENNVTFLDGGRDNGPGNTLYEFYNDFLPTVRGGDANNYTVAFRAQSFNADEDKYFYFTPFSLDKVTVESLPTINFTVNQLQRDQLKNNLIKYQIWYKKDLDKNWKLYIDNILTTQENSGKIIVKGTTKLLKGKYQIQVKAINIMNHEQQSNYLNLTLKK